MIEKRISKGLKVALFAIVLIAVLGFVVMSLWNSLMPPLFGLRLINFWQAVGLLLLSKILFGGFRGGPGRHGGAREVSRRHARSLRSIWTVGCATEGLSRGGIPGAESRGCHFFVLHFVFCSPIIHGYSRGNPAARGQFSGESNHACCDCQRVG
jgi:hypothetical protein